MKLKKNKLLGISFLFLLLLLTTSISFITFDLKNNKINQNSVSLSASEDNYEPNNNITTATDITFNEGMWLSSINGPGTQADDDYFEIFVGFGFERLQVDLIFSHIEGNIDLLIYDSLGFQVTGSSSPTDNEYIDYILPTDGSYYLRIFGQNASNNYDLWWFTLPLDDVYEPNDYDWEAYDLSSWSASWLPFGLGVQADEDWYMIYLNPGEERIFAELTFSHTAGNIDMEVWYWDGPFTHLAGSYSLDDNEYIDVNAPWSGTYFIRVYGDNAGNQYDLWWEDLTPFDDHYEDNDDYWSAAWVDPNYYPGLKIVGYDEDWFRTYLNPGDTIDIYLTNFNHDDGNLELELYAPFDSNNPQIRSYSSSSSFNEESISFTVQDQGDWRFRVYRVSGSVDVYYDLDIRVNRGEPIGDDPYEFNNVPDEAYFLGKDEQTWLSDIHGNAKQGDEDWYGIRVTPGFQQLVIDVQFNHFDGDIDISIYRVLSRYNIELIGGSYSFDDNEHFNSSIPGPGPYLIQIHGESSGNEYDLWWDDLRTDFRPEDNYEENDDPSTAYHLYEQLNPLRHINDIGLQYDNDWYMIDVEQGALQLKVVVLYEYSAGALGIKIYDSYLTEITSNFTMDDDEYINYVLPSNGTYYIRIFGDNSGSPYDMWWETREVSEEDIIPGYDIFILLSAIFGVVTIITLKWKRSKFKHK